MPTPPPVGLLLGPGLDLDLGQQPVQLRPGQGLVSLIPQSSVIQLSLPQGIYVMLLVTDRPALDGADQEATKEG